MLGKLRLSTISHGRPGMVTNTCTVAIRICRIASRLFYGQATPTLSCSSSTIVLNSSKHSWPFPEHTILQGSRGTNINSSTIMTILLGFTGIHHDLLIRGCRGSYMVHRRDYSIGRPLSSVVPPSVRQHFQTSPPKPLDAMGRESKVCSNSGSHMTKIVT